MFYSLFYCSLLLALFPLFDSSTTCSLPRHRTLRITQSLSPCHPLMLCRLFQLSLLITLSHAPYRTTARSLPPSHAPQALPPLAPHRATIRSTSPSHAPQALSNLALLRATTCFALRNHSLLATLPRSKIPLNTPCFVTRNIMAEGAKKHDDFRLPT